MIGRVIWIVALVVIGVVTALVQYDRQAEKTRAIASSVPEVVRSVAQRPVAAFALDGDDPEYALTEAERLVRRRPMPALHLRILAQAQFAAGRHDASGQTIQYAARRGWREPLAQEAVLRLAIEAGDMPEAARRYAALALRRDTEDALLEELGPAIFSEPSGEGLRTLSEIVGGGEWWHGQFLRRASRVMPPASVEEIVRSTTAAGTRYDCELLSQVYRALNQRDEDVGTSFNAMVEEICR